MFLDQADQDCSATSGFAAICRPAKSLSWSRPSSSGRLGAFWPFSQSAEASRDQAAGQAHRAVLQDAEVALQLVGRHLQPVVLPFGALVAQEVLEHLLAKDLRA